MKGKEKKQVDILCMSPVLFSDVNSAVVPLYLL